MFTFVSISKISQFSAAIAFLSVAATFTQAAEKPVPPNIIVILADDMGFSDLGCYGGEIHTPNLDRLAAGGLRFTHFYNTARCCPSRASLLTGLYPHQANVGHMNGDHGIDGYQGDLSRRAVTIAEVLRAKNYRTCALGKWHVSRSIAPNGPKQTWPLQRGFEKYYGILGGAANYFDPDTLCRDNTQFRAADDTEYPGDNYYLTDAISSHAVKFIEAHHKQNAAQPFFLYVAYTAAHWPLHAPESEIAKYRGKYDDGYEPIRLARFERERKMGLIEPTWQLSNQFGDWSQVKNKAWHARRMEVYAAQVDRMDQGIGRIVETLEKGKLLDNTMLMFMQDNGGCAEEIMRPALAPGQTPPMPGPATTFESYGEAWANVSNTPFRFYKHFVHEGGIATPLIVHWPAGIARHGALVHQPGHLIDIMPTCLEVSGADYPKQFAGETILPVEGRSLVPAFDDKTIPREAIFWEHEGNRAFRVGTWKLVAKGARGAWELYDMQKDRTEMHDLAASQPERMKEMVGLWERWARRTHAIPWPYGEPYGKKLPVGKGKGKQINAASSP